MYFRLSATIGGVLISWHLKGQSSVRLSTEAEYVTMLQCAQEIIFVALLL